MNDSKWDFTDKSYSLLAVDGIIASEYLYVTHRVVEIITSEHCYVISRVAEITITKKLYVTHGVA